MNVPLIITSIILVFAIILFLSDRIRADLVALLVLVALGISGVLTPQETFSGFSRSAVITILAIFILAEGLERTGVTQQIGNLLLRVGGTKEWRLIIVVMLAGAFLSLFMNNIAAAAVLLPAVGGAANKAKIHPARLLMPLAFSTILGGMATLFTTTNIVVSSLLRDQELVGFGVLDFAPVGIPLVLAGILYMALWGRFNLPAQSPLQQFDTGSVDDLTGVYRLDERLFRARIPAGSYLIGKTLVQSTFRETYNLSVIAIERGGKSLLYPPPDVVFEQGDVLLLQGKLDEFRKKDVEPYLEILPVRGWSEEDLESPEVVVVEVALTPRSNLIGQTLREVHFREKYGMNALAIWRAGRPVRTALTDLPLQFGDGLLLQGKRSRLPVLKSETNLIVLSQEDVTPVKSKGLLALTIMGLTILMASFSRLSVGEVMLGGALAMMLAGILTMDEGYRAIEWKSVFLVAGMLPMGIAITKTGLAAILTETLIRVLGGAGGTAILIGLFLLTVLLTQAMNGAAVAAIIAPIGINIALELNLNPQTIAMAIALATSTAFITPLGHPVNILVMGPGGYRFRDYVKVGLPLTILLSIVVIVLLPLIWPI